MKDTGRSAEFRDQVTACVRGLVVLVVIKCYNVSILSSHISCSSLGAMPVWIAPNPVDQVV